MQELDLQTEQQKLRQYLVTMGGYHVICHLMQVSYFKVSFNQYYTKPKCATYMYDNHAIIIYELNHLIIIYELKHIIIMP